MVCDSYFEKGDAHFVCQDYALHGSFDDLVYTIVADGCSSVPFSEIGAQILCHVAKYFLEFYYRTDILDPCNNQSKLLGRSIEKKADEIRKLYNLSRDSLEATLIIVLGIKDRVQVYAWGDGVIITKYKGGSYRVREICSPENAPFYLVSDPYAYRKYMMERSVPPIINHKIYTKNKSESEQYSIDAPFCEIIGPEKEAFWRLESITACSDGIASYKDENKNNVNILNVVPELVHLKTISGEFLKRRLSFFRRHNEKRLWTHYDDVSCATILTIPEETYDIG